MGCERAYIPYGRQNIDDDDITGVIDVLKSDWLTTGPKIEEFEQAFAEFCGVSHAVAVCNGTAALHCAAYAAGIQPGDEVVVTPMTFAASVNCVVYLGATPVFADVEPDTLLIDPAEVEKKITDRTRAIVAVDYAGQSCNYDTLRAIADRHGLVLIADACHAIGGNYKSRLVGSLADLSTFSFHPVKHMTTGEGGMVTTDNARFADQMRKFRNHGISTDHRERVDKGVWSYEMTDLGFNYRITDFQCALGLKQLGKLPEWVERRQAIAQQYDRTLKTVSGVYPLSVRPDVSHAYHLYVVKIDSQMSGAGRDAVFEKMRNNNIGVNVHYIPVHLHPYYQEHFRTIEGLCPVAEAAFRQVLSLPMFPGLTCREVDRVMDILKKALGNKL